MKARFAKSILALAATTAAVVYAAPTTASAGDRFDVRIEARDGHRGGGHDHVRKVWVPPVYEARCTKVWVEPVYRTECVNVWVPERHEVKCERVWVEPVYEIREVHCYERGRRVCRQERVCVRPGHWTTVERKVCIPGFYKQEHRQVCVTPGRWVDKHERVCVREGYWDTVVEHHRARPDRDRLSIGIFGRF